MYKVFLVDDEIVVREGIRSNFPWEKTDFVLAGEAPDGEMALDMLQDIKPDILITDIRMPFMDGLELCRAVSSSMPWMYVIILSGYDDFSYAKEAIKLGVKEYLLKPVSGEELLQVLNRMAERIREDNRQQDSMRTFRNQIASSGRLLREQLLSEIVLGMAEGDIGQRARALQMTLLARRYLTLIVDPAQENASPEDMHAALSALCRLAESSGETVHLCQLHGRFVLMIMGDDARDLEERAYGVAQAAQFELERNTSLKPLMAIGTAVTALDDVARSYADACELLKKLRAARGANEARRIVSMQDAAPDPSIAIVDMDLPPLYERLKHLSRDEVDAFLSDYFASIGESAAQSKMIANYIYVDILVAASKIIRDYGGDPQSVMPQAMHGGVDSLSIDQVQPMALKVLDHALACRDGQGSARYGVLIRKAKAYIDEHFVNPDLTLRDVAEHVTLSNNHFCTVFSQETGETFTEYLTGVRLNKAKEFLLDSAMRSSEIAARVGYNDPHYFGYLFRKRFGKSPRDYRREMAG